MPPVAGRVVCTHTGNNLHRGSHRRQWACVSKHTQEQHNEASGVLYSICEQKHGYCRWMTKLIGSGNSQLRRHIMKCKSVLSQSASCAWAGSIWRCTSFSKPMHYNVQYSHERAQGAVIRFSTAYSTYSSRMPCKPLVPQRSANRGVYGTLGVKS